MLSRNVAWFSDPSAIRDFDHDSALARILGRPHFTSMAEDDKSPSSPSTPEQPTPGHAIQDVPPLAGPSTSSDRTDLLEKARAFLSSPQVVHEDAIAKRKFLAEKGLNDAEIERLIQELVSHLCRAFWPCKSSEAHTDS